MRGEPSAISKMTQVLSTAISEWKRQLLGMRLGEGARKIKDIVVDALGRKRKLQYGAKSNCVRVGQTKLLVMPAFQLGEGGQLTAPVGVINKPDS